jgi:hypothetical protein
MNNDFKQEIVDHALRNAENLSMAIQIHNAFEDIKKQLFKTFAESLVSSLQTKLLEKNGWEINAEKLIKKSIIDPALFIINRSWSEGLRIGFQAESLNARDIVFIVEENVSKKLSEIKKNEIKVELEKKSVTPKGAGQNTIWFRGVQSDLMNWDNEVSLLKIQNGEALNYFTEELVFIAKTVDSICNR